MLRCFTSNIDRFRMFESSNADSSFATNPPLEWKSGKKRKFSGTSVVKQLVPQLLLSATVFRNERMFFEWKFITSSLQNSKIGNQDRPSVFVCTASARKNTNMPSSVYQMLEKRKRCTQYLSELSFRHIRPHLKNLFVPLAVPDLRLVSFFV